MQDPHSMGLMIAIHPGQKSGSDDLEPAMAELLKAIEAKDSKAMAAAFEAACAQCEDDGDEDEEQPEE